MARDYADRDREYVETAKAEVDRDCPGPGRATGGMNAFRQPPLDVLNYTPCVAQLPPQPDIRAAAAEVARYHPPTKGQAERHQMLASSAAEFLERIVLLAPPGPERTTAIERAREAKMWASAAIALESNPA